MSLTYFAAVPVDGASGYTEQASEPLPHARLTSGDVVSLEQPGASPSATTFASSTPNGSAPAPEPIDLFSFAVPHPARNTVPQTTEAAASTPTTCSLRPSASSPSLDLLGHRLRTHLASDLEDMTGSRMKWRRSATPAGRSWWVLPVPVRPIGADARGSWLLTPTETGNLACESMDKWPGGWGNFIPTGRANKGGLPDSHGAVPFIPTPAAQTGARKGAPELGGGGSGARKAAAQFLPTATAQDYGSNMGGAAGRTGKKRLSLSSLARSLGLSGRQFLAAIYENMMGFPPGWLSSVAQRMAMPSAPSSQNSSAARSSE